MINRNVNLKIFKMEVFIHLKKKVFTAHLQSKTGSITVYIIRPHFQKSKI